ncbi:hypothetical protein ACR3H8_33500 [Pseudomonas aeruginosa]|uniref:hypothetical protein n=1 Tax=Pseudomonas aeruginosa group TaxID=136841 RepID=UPI0003BAEC2E|nr:hypothetical protein [Pseudomonas aeruginosa]EIU2716253.1 hypothetical protein [Pseudomonas aeruginosa]EIU2863072.1 hypothetical protein [Pseudomonas aeruginosa]ELD5772958.1 hypothetical protein [Pseudomonas aeruginosa]ERW60463.1 hypothetical protein Q024_06583 [Pseudomonas aeruginosa BWHPSA011]ETV28693.1 hypothetical protein Q046_05610 [Pseudomonas aeruginosa BWHPSA041]
MHILKKLAQVVVFPLLTLIGIGAAILVNNWGCSVEVEVVNLVHAASILLVMGGAFGSGVLSTEALSATTVQKNLESAKQ